MGIVDLKTARDLMESVVSRAEQLGQTIASRDLRAQRQAGWARQWRLLRQSVQRLSRVLSAREDATPGGYPPSAAGKDVRPLPAAGSTAFPAPPAAGAAPTTKFGTAAPGSVPEAAPEWEAERSGLEVRARSAESALAALDETQSKLDAQWLKVWQDLEGIHEDWLLLRSQSPRNGLSASAAAEAGLQEKAANIERLWTELIHEDGEVMRERAALQREWNRLVGLVLPRVEEAAESDAEGKAWKQIAERLRHIDRRWVNLQGVLRTPLNEEQSAIIKERVAFIEQRSGETKERIEKVNRENFALSARLAELEGEKARLENDAKAAREEAVGSREETQQVREECERLRGELHAASIVLENLKFKFKVGEEEREGLRKRLESTAEDFETIVEKYSQASKALEEAENGRSSASPAPPTFPAPPVPPASPAPAAQPPVPPSWETQTQPVEPISIGEDPKRLARELRMAQETLDMTRRELELLKKELQAQMGSNLAPGRESGEPLPAQDAVEAHEARQGGADVPETPSGPTPSMESVEPVLDPVWRRVIAALRQSLAAAYAHLRRLAASPMQTGQRTVVQMAAASLAAAQDTLKAAGEFLDDGVGPMKAGRLEPVLDAALTAWEPALRARGATIIRKFDRESPAAMFHADSLRVVLHQILRNAYEAMPRGGCLTARSWFDEATGQVCASFLDAGPGFSKPILEKLFAPFESAKTGHLGLGLALARRVMRRFGGDAEAANAAPGGAMVVLRFSPAAGQTPSLTVNIR